MEAKIESDAPLLSFDEIVKWLALLKCPRLGYVSFSKITEHLAEPLDVFSLNGKELSRFGLFEPQVNYLQNPNWQYAQQMADWLLSNQIQLLPLIHTDFPELLKQTARPPLALFVKGNYNLLSSIQVAFVGTRKPTPYGEQATQALIEQLPQSVTITSGLAIGIDGVAHKSALAFGKNTIAVMGTGFQLIYPKRHQFLAEQIAQQGCLVSEFLPDVPAVQHNFPRRNRIIAGLSQGTLVVEAAIKSGSLITAQYALEEGREVFAIPGNIFSDVSQGGHQLIQQGAKLVTTAADIVEEWQGFSPITATEEKKHLAGQKLLASVDHDTTPVDVIVQRSNLPVEQVLMELLELEVQGAVIAVPGGYIKVA